MPKGGGFKVSGEGGSSEGGVGVRGGRGIGRFEAMVGTMSDYWEYEGMNVCERG